MAEGASLVEVAAEIGINRDTIYERCNPDSPTYDKEFSDTIKKGKELCAAWWEREGRKGLKDKQFNATLWYMNMRNRFGWHDNQKVDITTDGQALKFTGFSFLDPIAKPPGDDGK